jgi:hypothetical protein
MAENNNATCVDLTTSSGKYVLSNSKKKETNKIGSVIKNVEDFADNLSVTKCYQFGESSMSSVAGLGGQCSTNIMDMLETTLKNNAIARFINTNIKKINNAIDGVKSFGNKVKNSTVFKKVKGFYCGTLAPAMKILLMLLNSLISVPLTILKGIYKFLNKLRDVANSVMNKLFDCMGGYIQGMQDSIGTFDFKPDMTIKDLLFFLDDLSKFLENCEVISRPLINSFNDMINPCSSVSMRTIFDKIGMTTPDYDEPILCSAEDLINFINRRNKIITLTKNEINQFINKFNPIDGIFNAAKALTQISRTYTTIGIAKLHEAIIKPVHKMEAMYNNFLSSRSRLLGKIVNAAIGWLLPNCGSSKFDEGLIRRRKYSIRDVLNILDSMHGCNTYLCGNINNQVQTLLATLETNKFGFWINPLVKANDNIGKMIDNVFSKTFGEEYDANRAGLTQLNIDPDFIKKLQPYSTRIQAVV